MTCTYMGWIGCWLDKENGVVKEREPAKKNFGRVIELSLSGCKVRFTFVGDASGNARENAKQMIMKAYSERIKK